MNHLKVDEEFPLLVTQSVEALLAQESAIAKLEKQTLMGKLSKAKNGNDIIQ